jgi:hypothetical protein
MLRPSSSRPDVPAAYGIVGENEGRGLLDWSWAEERLRGRYIWWLATTRPDGRPHLMPVWAVWIGEGVAFSTGAGTSKAKNIAANPFVTIVPERGVESVIVEGEVVALPEELLAAFVAAYTEAYGMDPTAMGEPVFLVKPKKAFGFIDEDDGFPLSATRWTFD